MLKCNKQRKTGKAKTHKSSLNRLGLKIKWRGKLRSITQIIRWFQRFDQYVKADLIHEIHLKGSIDKCENSE
jgi:hypothetical protein